MVIIATRNDHQFHYEDANPAIPIEKERANYFTYEEKPDYTPVTIELTGIDKIDLKEIGLKLDGICKGAVVVENDVEQICAYLDIDEKLTDGNVELIFYYASKNQPQAMKSMTVGKSKLISSTIMGAAEYPVYRIKLKPEDLTNVIPQVFALEQNYPNPFNPVTQIKYALNESGTTSLDIYNLKGQLVKTLVRGHAEKGNYNVSWNGTDNSGKTCASGMYFYKLKTEHNTSVKKMLMVK